MIKKLVSKLKENWATKENRSRIVRLGVLGLCLIWTVFVFNFVNSVEIFPPSELEPLVGIEPPVEISADINATQGSSVQPNSKPANPVTKK